MAGGLRADLGAGKVGEGVTSDGYNRGFLLNILFVIVLGVDFWGLVCGSEPFLFGFGFSQRFIPSSILPFQYHMLVLIGYHRATLIFSKNKNS